MRVVYAQAIDLVDKALAKLLTLTFVHVPGHGDQDFILEAAGQVA